MDNLRRINTKTRVAMVSIFLAASLLFVPIPELADHSSHALSIEARNLAAIFIVTLALWVTELLPIAVTA